MVLERLELQNFRSFKNASFEFPPELTLIIGPNTSGKTNILEAIFLLATGRTFRPGLEREMIRWGEEIGRVKGFVSTGIMPARGGSACGGNNELGTEDTIELEVVLTGGEVQGKPVAFKKCFVNGVSKKQSDFVGSLNVVIFGPEDLELVTNSPSLRRAHLDFVLEQIDREYRRRLVAYGKALSQRNRLLKLIGERRRSEGELEYWDKLVVENGSYLVSARSKFFEFVNGLPKKLGEFEFAYQLSKVSPEQLAEYRSREIAAGMTLVGPHRDDFSFEVRNPKSEIRNRNLTIFGSRGEQRTAVLALKLSELEFMTKILGERPVLLLDDIFSELDRKNRKHVLEVIPKQQTIVTTTDLGLVEKGFLAKMKVIDLSKNKA